MTEITQIKTLTPIYDQIEDQIRFCINYQDVLTRIDFMITRAFMIDLIFNIDGYIHTYYPTTVLANDISLQGNSNESMDSTQNVTSTVNEDIELYKTREDLLITLQLQYDKGNKFTRINFISKNNFQATILLDMYTLQQILWSIKRAIPATQWGMSL